LTVRTGSLTVPHGLHVIRSLLRDSPTRSARRRWSPGAQVSRSGIDASGSAISAAFQTGHANSIPVAQPILC
jgi:hypothetical protein